MAFWTTCSNSFRRSSLLCPRRVRWTLNHAATAAATVPEPRKMSVQLIPAAADTWTPDDRRAYPTRVSAQLHLAIVQSFEHVHRGRPSLGHDLLHDLGLVAE